MYAVKTHSQIYLKPKFTTAVILYFLFLHNGYTIQVKKLDFLYITNPS